MTNPTNKPFSSPATNEEKLDALFNEKALRKANRGEASTLQQFANSDAAQDAGRFAAVNKANVVGAKPLPEYPRQPEGSFSNQAAVVPDEEPLGFVDEPPIVGESFEVAASIEALERTATQQGDLLPSHAEGRDVGAAGSLIGHEVEPPPIPYPNKQPQRRP